MNYRQPKECNLTTEQAWWFCRCCTGREVCSGEAFFTCSSWRIKVAEKAVVLNRIYKYNGETILWSGINH